VIAQDDLDSDAGQIQAERAPGFSGIARIPSRGRTAILVSN